MKKNRTIIFIRIITEIIVVILGITALAIEMSEGGEGDVSVNGAGVFRYFTNDGNIYSFLVAGAGAVTDVLLLTGKIKNYPKWLYALYLGAAVTEIVIFVVVVAVLTPMGLSGLFSTFTMVTYHAVIPALITLLFLFAIPGKLNKKEAFYGAGPLYLYAIVSILMVVTKTWTGDLIPYPFLDIYGNPWWETVVSIIGFIGGGYLLSLFVAWSNNKIQAKLPY